MIDTAALREKVLDLAIRGKLVPQDPNDEPASVLLERIRQQKQQMVKDGKLKPKDIKGDTVIFVGDDNLHYEKFPDGTVKCIEDEIPFDLPDNWAWVRLQSISSMSNGTAKRKGSEGTETIVLRLADLGESEISFSTTRSVVLTDGEIQKYALSVGDVLFIRVNGSKENVGKSFCFDNESVPIAYCDHLIRCTPTGALCGKLLSMFMRCGYVRQLIGERTVSAAGQHTISQPSLATILLPVPPLKEQDRIIYRLNKSDSYISQISNSKQELAEIVLHAKSKILDIAIRGQLVPQDPNDEPASLLLERIRAEKEELIRQGKIKRDKKESVIFRGEDNSYYEKIGAKTTVKCIDDEIPFEIPLSWKWCRLGQIFLHNTGKALNSSDTTGCLMTYITTSNLYWDSFVLDSLKEMYFSGNEIEKCTVKKGDLLVCEGGDIGRAAIWNYDEEIRIQNHIHKLRPYTEVSNRFFYYVFLLWKLTDRIGGRGIGLQGFSSKSLHNLMIPLPPYKEQLQIASHIDLLFSLLEKVEKSLS